SPHSHLLRLTTSPIAALGTTSSSTSPPVLHRLPPARCCRRSLGRIWAAHGGCDLLRRSDGAGLAELGSSRSGTGIKWRMRPSRAERGTALLPEVRSMARSGHSASVRSAAAFSTAPWGKDHMYTYLDRIVLKETECGIAAVNRILRELYHEWTGHSYDLLPRNCNHFAMCFVRGSASPSSQTNNTKEPSISLLRGHGCGQRHAQHDMDAVPAARERSTARLQ
ncbi:unnamed protein product, partial [Urochloa humidicola]